MVTKILDSKICRAVFYLLYPVYWLFKQLSSLTQKILKVLYSFFLQIEFASRSKNYKFAKKTFIEPSCKFQLSKNAQVILGDNVNIDKNCVFKLCKDAKLEIKENTYIGPNTHIYIDNDMSIGKGSIFGPFCFLIDHEHIFDLKSKLSLEHEKSSERDAIKIGNYTWLGAKATVMKGVNIGDYCVIGAGSVVTKNVESNSVTVGVPAKTIKRA